jgi:hypothetical protein
LIQEWETNIDLFHEMSATEMLPRMTTITHNSMSGYANMIGNFGQVMIQPHNVSLQGIKVILNEGQINPWSVHGFWCNFRNRGCCLGGITKEVVAEQLYDKYSNEEWRDFCMMKQNNNA